MNLDANPTKQQLRELIAACDDDAGDHILWVTRGGEVELSTIPRDQTGAEFEDAHPEMQLRCETMLAGNEYVGRDAANNDDWVSELFDGLLNRWRATKGKGKVDYLQIS